MEEGRGGRGKQAEEGRRGKEEGGREGTRDSRSGPTAPEDPRQLLPGSLVSVTCQRGGSVRRGGG